VDLTTSPMTIKMINSDYGQLMKDYEMLRLIESNYFQLFYTLNEKVPACKLETDIKELIKYLDPARRFLIVKDDGKYVAQYGQIQKDEGWQIYDGSVYAECGETTSEERYRSMFKAMHDVRDGGVCIIVPEAYRNLKSGSVVAEFIMNIAGVQVVAPTYDSVGILAGVKK